MSAESENPPPHRLPAEGDQPATAYKGNIVRDVFMWRRKKLGAAVLLVATATWTVLQVYEFNFVTVASWLSMFLLTSAFLWGNIQRLFNKEPPRVSSLEIPEQKAVEMTYVIRSWMEEVVRWMFRVGAAGHLFAFAGTIAALWVASELARYFDFLTLLYIGIVFGMTLPVIYVKNEDRIKGLGERSRMQFKRLYCWLDDKVLRKIKNKVAGEKKEKKEKKIE